jgi:hypothetical protein
MECAYCLRVFEADNLINRTCAICARNYVICQICYKCNYDCCLGPGAQSPHSACVMCRGGREISVFKTCIRCTVPQYSPVPMQQPQFPSYGMPLQQPQFTSFGMPLQQPQFPSFGIAQTGGSNVNFLPWQPPPVTFLNPHTTQTQAAISPPELRLGVITWNVAHYGEQPIELWRLLNLTNDATDDLLNGFLTKYFEAMQWDAIGQLEMLDQVPLNTKTAAIRNWFWKLERLVENATTDRMEDAFAGFQIAWEDLWDDSDDEGMDLQEKESEPKPVKTSEGMEILTRSHFLSSRVKCARAVSDLRDALKPFFLSDALREFGNETGWYSPFANQSPLSILLEKGAKAYHAAVNLDKALHKYMVVLSVVEMFRDNEWLDVLILQEINLGLDNFIQEVGSYAKKSGVGLGCHASQQLKSDSSADGSQSEYYLIVYAQRKGKPIQVKQSMLATTAGKIVAETEKPFLWNKTAETPTYRPVVLYEVTVADSPVLIGAVHTTPFGDEHKMERCDVFAELEQALKEIKKTYGDKMPLIIGGDYYLTGEARTFPSYNLEPHQKEAIVKAWAEELAATNQARRQQKLKAKSENQLQKEINTKITKLKEGKIADAWFTTQLNRNRNVTGKLVDKWHVTVAQRLEYADWQVIQTVSGTNWDNEEEGWFNLRIADFFLTTGWKSFARGLVTPLGGIVELDTSNLQNARYWRLFSDHFPVGGCFSTRTGDPWVQKAFIRSSKAALNADLINLDIEQGTFGNMGGLYPILPADFEPQPSGKVVGSAKIGK